MGGQGEGHDGGRAGEAQAACGEAVEAWRPGRGVAVAADVVGAQRVEGHDQEVAWPPGKPRGPHSRSAREEHTSCRGGHDEDGDDDGGSPTHQARILGGFASAGKATRFRRGEARLPGGPGSR